MSEVCPCSSGSSYNDCCGPFHSGKSWPEFPEKLMRARYSAFAKGAVNFLHDSLHPDHRGEFDIDGMKTWAESSTWSGLEIIEAFSDEETPDTVGHVEFCAAYEIRGQHFDHHELSHFHKADGKWYYVDGEVFHTPIRRSDSKVGRNDPCSCGSGKKYKKCCGR